MKTLYLFCLIFCSAFSQDKGDDCQLPSIVKSAKRISGKCTQLKECPTVIADLKRGKYPHICSFQGLEAIVCCPEMPKITERVLKSEGQPENPNRISKQKCREYGNSVYKNKTILGMNGPYHVNISTCAIKKTPSLIEESIFAKEREFPHMALIGFGPEKKKTWLCSGSLISEKFVLTVAHCTSSPSHGIVKWVRLGDLDFESPNDAAMLLEIQIHAVHRHPKYQLPVFYNDIALLELQQSVAFSEYIRPACLYTGNDAMLDKFIISGWALVAIGTEDNKGHLRQNKHIRKVANDKCNESYKSLVGRRLKNGIDGKLMVCTDEAQNDACEISSGAALQIHNNDVYCMYDIVGITSFGKGFCGSTPVVHTRVSPYINWIEAIVWPQIIHMM